MQAFILKSNSGNRFHFGKALAVAGKDSHALASVSEYLHSDTLFSAIVNAWALCCPETVENFIPECREGNFKLSSAFYCIEKEKNKVFFLPKPVSLNLFDFDNPKKMKKIKFISKGVWESGLLPENWFEPEKCTLLQNESIVALKSEIDKPFNLFKTETMPHTQARDISKEKDNFYFQTDLFLSNGVNWYFLVENNLSEDLQSDFEKVMKTLVNLGIGGERSSGCGHLTEYQTVDFNIEIKDTTYHSSLSLIAPNENELSKNSLYQVIKRGGRFLETGKSLPTIQMLLEGAVFDTEIKGRIVELNDKPPILRYGLNLSIPLHNNFITK